MVSRGYQSPSDVVVGEGIFHFDRYLVVTSECFGGKPPVRENFITGSKPRDEVFRVSRFEWLRHNIVGIVVVQNQEVFVAPRGGDGVSAC